MNEDVIKALDPFLPDVLALLFVQDEVEKRKIKKLGELCQKHGVPFSKYTAIVQEYGKWEATL